MDSVETVPFRNRGKSMSGNFKFRGADKVIPRDCCATMAVWIAIVAPSLFILIFV